jgi:acyl dehydratase
VTNDVDDSLIGDEARSFIGTVIERGEGRVVRKEFQRWAAAVKDRNPLYFDADYARAQGYRDVIAPPLYFQYATTGVADLDQLRPDGIPLSGAGDIPLPKCPRRLAGGQDIVFHEPLYDGDVVTVERTVTGLQQKQGRSGSFVVISMTTTYTRQDGAPVAEIHASTIARP